MKKYTWWIPRELNINKMENFHIMSVRVKSRGNYLNQISVNCPKCGDIVNFFVISTE